MTRAASISIRCRAMDGVIEYFGCHWDCVLPITGKSLPITISIIAAILPLNYTISYGKCSIFVRMAATPMRRERQAERPLQSGTFEFPLHARHSRLAKPDHGLLRRDATRYCLVGRSEKVRIDIGGYDTSGFVAGERAPGLCRALARLASVLLFLSLGSCGMRETKRANGAPGGTRTPDPLIRSQML